ncbi:MAG TPA: ThuA domain-containing protein [Azospirillaceae bacterium]|nr:ThuA domain-containing protein [Azospirillaceae bacterium]
MVRSLRATVWNEFRHDRQPGPAADTYPGGIHTHLARILEQAGLAVRTAVLDEPEHGLTEAVLDQTDVLLWWGHKFHADVDDAVVERVKRRVLEGMGLVALHSSHFSKPFLSLLGTSGRLRWRATGERERIWVVDPAHPIADGVGPCIEIDREEMYGEPFDVPPPDELVFISWFRGGEVFRSGCCWRRGRGRIFYFRPGHETFRAYHDPQVQRVIVNAARWAGATPAGTWPWGRTDAPPEPLD